MSDEFNRGLYFHRQKDYQQAAYWYKKGAEKGDAKSQCSLGVFAQIDEKDYQQAEYWFTKAAEQGETKAQHYLGSLYASEEYGLYDRRKAKFWLGKAAIQGDDEALDYLEAIVEVEEAEAEYMGTVDVKARALFGEAMTFFKDKQYDKAMPLLEELANKGYAKAQYNLGVCYGRGEGVQKDDKKSIKWLCDAAKQGYSDAIQILRQFL